MRPTLFAILLLIVVNTHGQFTNVASSTNTDIAGNKDGGCSFADFNNDGCLDLLVNTNDNTLRSRLLMSDCNLPNPTFTDVTTTHAPEFLSNKLERSAVWGDYNNDGYIDLARNRSGRLEIYLNQGPSGSPAWSFGDSDHDPNYMITGLTNGLNCEGLAWMDYNGDGFLDMILENHNYGVDILRNPADCSSNFYHITPNSSPLGLLTSATDGDYMASSDYNDDGWVDLLCRKRDEIDLIRNDGGTFTSIANIDNATNGNKGGVLFADFDNDGYMDLFWTSQGTNQIWTQNASHAFSASGEPASSSGVALGTGIDGCAAADVDNDGDLDLFLTDNSGDSYLFINQSTPGNLNFYRDNLNIDVNGNGEGCVFADYDNDGDMDLYVNRYGGNQLWRNSTNDANYLFVEPLLDLGGGFTRVDHGATAILRSSDGSVIKGGIRDSRSSFGHGNQHNSSIHFGLPDGPDATYELTLKFTNIGGERIEIDTLIVPSDLTDQKFRMVRDSFGVLVNIGCNILPVELISFRANAHRTSVMLNWETASEINNDRFIIERSTDASSWEYLGESAGSGTTQLPQQYEFIDGNPNQGINYYRLIQQDYNGDLSAPWLAAASIEAEAFSIRVYPNPIKPSHTTWFLQISGMTEAAVSISMHSSSGEMVLHRNLQANASQMTLELEKPTGCSPGVYFIKASYNGKTITRRIIFQ